MDAGFVDKCPKHGYRPVVVIKGDTAKLPNSAAQRSFNIPLGLGYGK